MTHPAPPGGFGPPAPPAPGGWDPRAAALGAWAQQRGYELVLQPDQAFWQSWLPFQYLRRAERVLCEVRFGAMDARVFVGEVRLANELGQLTGEARAVHFYLLSPRLAARACVRSKQGAGFTDDIGRGFEQLGSLFSGKQQPPPGSFLGDPTLEARCDVIAPSPQEGAYALTPSLRQLLAHPSFRGVLELRQGGLAADLYDVTAFEPQALDFAIQRVGQLYQAAVAYPGA